MDFYVYALIDPRDGQPFYIGKGKGNRRFAHVSEARNGKARNFAKAARIKDVEAAGMEVEARILRAGLHEAAALRLERETIAELKSQLTNIAGGSISADENALIELDDMLCRVKPFDQWFMDAEPAHLESAQTISGGAAEFYAKLVGSLFEHREHLVKRIAINIEASHAV